MRDSDADIAIDVLNKLIDQELKAASAGMRDGNRILEECASTRYHAYTFARDEIGKALADAVEERDAENPFLPQRDELVTQDMHTCDLCGRWCPSPVYRVCLCYADQSRWRPMCAPTACGGLDSGRSGRCRSRHIGGMSGGCRSIRREGGVDMATNVTQRNEVLRELLRWHLEKGGLAANRLFDGVTPPRQADVVCGELRAHTESSNHILSMLGYPDALPPAGRCPDDLSDR